MPRAARAAVAVAALLTALVVNRLAHLSAGVIRAENAVIQRAELMYVPNDTMLSLLTLGYRQAAADLLWVRTLGYFARHFESDRQYTWLEHFVEQILRFDPDFRRVYFWAGANVLYGRRFTNENVERSNRFYALAMARFPDDYEPAYRLGLNYYVEMRSEDPDTQLRFREQGLSHLELASTRKNAPENLRSLVAGISNKLGKSQLAVQYLTDLYLSTEDPEQREGLRARIAQLQAEGQAGPEFSATATRYRDQWQRLYGYAPAELHGLLGEPDTLEPPDLDWRTLAGVAPEEQ